MKTGTTIFPKEYWSLSRIIATVRIASNIETSDAYKMGAKLFQTDALGVLGELIAIQHMVQSRAEYEYTGFASGAAQVADIITERARLDVKTVSAEARFLQVSAEAHTKDKGVTHYWFIQPVTEIEARWWIFPASAVDRWPVVESTFSPVRQMEIAGLGVRVAV